LFHSEELLDRSDSATKLNVSAGKPVYRQKNARLTQVIPPDVLLLKGEVLRSAISHLEVECLAEQGRQFETPESNKEVYVRTTWEKSDGIHPACQVEA
jgi:hypothetical protein